MAFCSAALVFILFLTGCSSSGESATESSGGGEDGAQSDQSGSSGNADSDGGGDEGASIDTDDAAEIVGSPDLNLEDLAEVAPDAAEALDAIDDIVSIGDCQSELIGLAMGYVPDGWECRVFSDPVAGLDGFTLFKPDNAGGLEITIGKPTGLGTPCEILDVCDEAEDLDIGDDFDLKVVQLGGIIPLIFGTHNTVDAEVSVVTAAALSDDELAFVAMVLDGVVEI